MDVNFAPEDEAFRAEVRSFIEDNYPKHLVGADRGDLSKEDFLAWHKSCTRKVGSPQAGRKNSAVPVGP